ncbi:non-LTR retroelement reverse transcriptase-like protein [Cucumis melo var. makuwa]|uniref:Non-LTR retroelement reverse transcriptase-like protein n=1 Tax=Cucumis melo var. makuwa TaxID=1194695 RepID=A0A5A7U8G1_CUCMM|nr:non-LTR retroelement reverse transcriptase-like protein [Cucumis melo var. makuwa]
MSFQFFNHWVEDPSFIEVVARMWSSHEGVSPLVSLMRNLHHLKPILHRRFGRHIKSLSEEMRIAKEAMDIAQREVERNPMSDVLSRQASLATETFWTAVRLEEASLRQKSRIRWVSSHDGVAQMAALQLLISREEVRRVLFSMDSGKAPGSDGFSVGFFKGAWFVVGEDFCDAVLHFFETCYLPVGVNATAITLIPKHNGAKRLEDFRPISCCNVLYKCISKILVDRLHVWLPSFISSNQSAFILGRSIIENILLCQELVGGYHLNSGKPRCTLKVDLQKAYDSVNWNFLFGLLIAIGTPLKFVSWIRTCVTSPMFSIMINGSLEGVFHGRKDVRQGNPLSPFLFVMVMEVLSRMLNKIPQSFQFHHRCEKVKLTHLTFADDLMIFCAADEPSIRFIRECLQKFGELSGLFANPRKSFIFVAGVNNENASQLAACMGFVRGNLPVRYLGLPLLTGRLRSNDCAPMIQRITSRIRSWIARVLSFAGRLQLVCSVLRSLQVYWASVFVLPAYVHNEEGGLDIRDGPSWNIASTLKILWLMLTSLGSLWVAWVEAYILKGRSLWDVDSRVGRSWCLRAILRGAILEQVGERVLYDAASRREARLSDFIGSNGEWLWSRVFLELINLWDRVQEVSPCLSVSDSWVWVPGRQGGFSIASAWKAIRPRGGRVLWDGLLWGGRNIPKHSFCAWLAIKDRLGTRDRLHRVLRIMASSHRIGHWGVELSWICHQGIGKGVRSKLWRVL